LKDDPFVKEALNHKPLSGTQVLLRDALSMEGKALAGKAVFPLVPTPKEKPIKKLDQTSGVVVTEKGHHL
jgi:hypothetical protein